MTDHAGLLRQIRTDARPYIEQALDLAEVFTGFRKLASENGLDWGVIKALIKAEVQDEREGGSEKVERIIEKADFASAYADMLGLRSANMNEFKITSELPPAETVRPSADIQGSGPPAEGNGPPLPPHDPDTGEINDVPAPGPATAAPVQGTASEEAHRSSSDASSQPLPPADRDLTSPCLQAATVSPPGAVAAPCELEDIPPGLREKRVAA